MKKEKGVNVSLLLLSCSIKNRQENIGYNGYFSSLWRLF